MVKRKVSRKQNNAITFGEWHQWRSVVLERPGAATTSELYLFGRPWFPACDEAAPGA